MIRLAIFFSHFLLLISSYTLQEIANDVLETDYEELVPYRGPILKDIWVGNKFSAAADAKVCKKLFQKSLPKTLPIMNVAKIPAREPPAKLKDFYTMGGRADFQTWYFNEDQQQNSAEKYIWGRTVMQDFMEQPNICGGYNQTHCDYMIKKHAKWISNLSGIVVGSQSPWAEAALFNAGARKIVTIEFRHVVTDFPNYSGQLPSEVAKIYLASKWPGVDFAFSFSTLEHDGLGRYGDELNPFGDLESLARIRCLLKPGGILFLGVPFAPEAVIWNAHRLYGRERVALMLLGWDVLDIAPADCDMDSEEARGSFACQPIVVLRKPLESNETGGDLEIEEDEDNNKKGKRQQQVSKKKKSVKEMKEEEDEDEEDEDSGNDDDEEKEAIKPKKPVEQPRKESETKKNNNAVPPKKEEEPKKTEAKKPSSSSLPFCANEKNIRRTMLRMTFGGEQRQWERIFF
jgi:hypothetical protein